MHGVRSWSWQVMGVALLAVQTGCATAARRAETPAEQYLRVRDSVEAVAAANRMEAAPEIRVFVRPAGQLASSYVDADFRVDDDGYALVLAVDYDNRVRVLFPESPGAQGFLTPRATTGLHTFFAGFGPTVGDPRYRFLRGGVIVALASARPFQVERITDSHGAWDERAILRLLDRPDALRGADELGRALTLVGQDYSYDFATFRVPAARTLSLASRSRVFAECGAASSSYFGALPDPSGAYGSFDSPVRYVQVGDMVYAQYLVGPPGCGDYSGLVPVRRIVPQPPTPRDTTKRDSATAVTTLRLREGPRVSMERQRELTGDVRGSERGSGLEAGSMRFHRPIDERARDGRWAPRERPTRADESSRASRENARSWRPAAEGAIARRAPSTISSPPVRAEPARSEPARASGRPVQKDDR